MNALRVMILLRKSYDMIAIENCTTVHHNNAKHFTTYHLPARAIIVEKEKTRFSSCLSFSGSTSHFRTEVQQIGI